MSILSGQRLSSIVLCIALLALCSCGSGLNVVHDRPRSAPIITVSENANPHFENFKTFSIQPSYDTLDRSGVISPYASAFYLRICLENQGYRFVTISDTPDFIVTLDLRSEYHAGRIPLNSIALPEFEHDKYITVEQSDLGVGAEDPQSSFGRLAVGAASDGGYSFAGYLLPKTSPLYHGSSGDYYWIASVHIYDGTTHELIWLGNGIAWSSLENYKLSYLPVLSVMCRRIPNCLAPRPTVHEPSGLFGFRYVIYSADGEHFFPMVFAAFDDGPVNRAGVKIRDFLIRVNGVSTVDRTFMEAYKMLAGDAGVAARLTIGRLDDTLDFTVVRGAKSDVVSHPLH